MFLKFPSLSRYKLLTGGVGGEGGRGANLTTRPEKSTFSWSSSEVTSCAPNQKRINLKLEFVYNYLGLQRKNNSKGS